MNVPRRQILDRALTLMLVFDPCWLMCSWWQCRLTSSASLDAGLLIRMIPAQASQLMAYDPRDGTAKPLVPYYLPISANYFDFAPDMSMGVIDDGIGLQEQVRWLRVEGLEVVPLDLAEARRPRWAPDGTTIALEGTTDSSGVVGPARATLPSTLYLLSPSDEHLKLLVHGARDSMLLAWSPDSHWLAMVTTLNGTRGLWLVEAATGAIQLVMAGEHFGAPAFAPDGASVVVVVDEIHIFQSAPGSRVGLEIISLPHFDAIVAKR